MVLSSAAAGRAAAPPAPSPAVSAVPQPGRPSSKDASATKLAGTSRLRRAPAHAQPRSEPAAAARRRARRCWRRGAVRRRAAGGEGGLGHCAFRCAWRSAGAGHQGQVYAQRRTGRGRQAGTPPPLSRHGGFSSSRSGGGPLSAHTPHRGSGRSPGRVRTIVSRPDGAARCAVELAGRVDHWRRARRIPAAQTWGLHVFGGHSHDDAAGEPGTAAIVGLAAAFRRGRRGFRPARLRRRRCTQGAATAPGGGAQCSAALAIGTAAGRAWSGTQNPAPGQIDDEGRAAALDEDRAARRPSAIARRWRSCCAWGWGADRPSRTSGAFPGAPRRWECTAWWWSGHAPCGPGPAPSPQAGPPVIDRR